MSSLFQVHVQRWGRGCGSNLCEDAKNVCLSRGKVPCEVLFIGEAPGESENVLGIPFCGPAGALLDRIIASALDSSVRVAYTNLVCCIPRTQDGGKAGQPPVEEIRSCQPRLVEFVRVANPRLIVCVGGLARDWHDTKVRHRVKYHRPLWWMGDLMNEREEDAICVIDILHPAAILRANVVQRGLMIQRCVVGVTAAYRDLDDALEPDVEEQEG